MVVFKECWICPPECTKEHNKYEVATMLGLTGVSMHEVGGMGLRPYRTEGLSWYYRCQDVQDFVYDLQVPVGICFDTYLTVRQQFDNWRIYTKIERDLKQYRASLVRPGLAVSKSAIKKARAALPKPGFIYLFQWNDIYKIGLSRNVHKRFLTFGQLPGTFEFVHKISVQDMRASEKALHEKYSEYKVKGEWFSLPQCVVEHICSLKDGDLDEKEATA